ncbi:DUF2197 domain-containing protein [Syntrophomonas palmitatica]|uniref:DUF2197 domain-containing protein n=1 Tax=Syntrophomonas palmitatica TaxID=402877 RepID=UPI0006D0D1EC|nr:DUF2197 domain-containing protein [Syntrophomonas palmitatica]
MSTTIDARCLMCGKTYAINEEHQDYKKLAAKEKEPTFICDLCNRKVRHEADEDRKPKKPI